MGRSSLRSLLCLSWSIGRSHVVVSFLVGESVRGGRDEGFGTILVGFDDDNLCIFILFLLVALDEAIGNKGEDPQHPEENSDATSENESNCSTFPRTQQCESHVNALHERLLSLLMVGTAMVILMVVVVMVVVVMFAIALFLAIVVVVDLGVDNSGRSADERKDAVLELSRGR